MESSRSNYRESKSEAYRPTGSNPKVGPKGYFFYQKKRARMGKKKQKRMINQKKKMAERAQATEFHSLAVSFTGINVSSSDRGSQKEWKFDDDLTRKFDTVPSTTSSLEKPDQTVKQETPLPNVKDEVNAGENTKAPGDRTAQMVPKGPFPDLVIFFGSAKKLESGVKCLESNFSETSYGPLEVEVISPSAFEFTVKLICQGKCLSEATSCRRREAEEEAVSKLVEKLRKTNYIIEENRFYSAKKRFRELAANADPKQSHIYRVVCMNPSWQKPPFPLKGAVDYVHSYEELWKYIEQYAKSKSKADLFLLNLGKNQRTLVIHTCEKYGLLAHKVAGTSNTGVMASRPFKVRDLLQELLACGGETIKYRLIPPQSTEAIRIKKESDEDESDDEAQEGAPHQEDRQGEQQIEISEWVANKLVLMEILNEKNKLESTFQIIYSSVKYCFGKTSEFLVEKRVDQIGRTVVADAMINRQLVGKGKSYMKARAKTLAAENAMYNLRQCCYYIEAKESYFGTGERAPAFVYDRIPSKTNTYRFVGEGEVTDIAAIRRLFKQFKSSRVQDLYFLDEIVMFWGDTLYGLAISTGLLVRYLGKTVMCVYKRQFPKQVLKQLMSLEWKENDKYRLIEPPTKLNQPHSEINNRLNEQKRKFQQLFDFKKDNIPSVQNTDKDQGSSTKNGSGSNLSQVFNVVARSSTVVSEHPVTRNINQLNDSRHVSEIGKPKQMESDTKHFDITPDVWLESEEDGSDQQGRRINVTESSERVQGTNLSQSASRIEQVFNRNDNRSYGYASRRENDLDNLHHTSKGTDIRLSSQQLAQTSSAIKQYHDQNTFNNRETQARSTFRDAYMGDSNRGTREPLNIDYYQHHEKESGVWGQKPTVSNPSVRERENVNLSINHGLAERRDTQPGNFNLYSGGAERKGFEQEQLSTRESGFHRSNQDSWRESSSATPNSFNKVTDYKDTNHRMDHPLDRDARPYNCGYEKNLSGSFKRAENYRDPDQRMGGFLGKETEQCHRDQERNLFTSNRMDQFGGMDYRDSYQQIEKPTHQQSESYNRSVDGWREKQLSTSTSYTGRVEDPGSYKHDTRRENSTSFSNSYRDSNYSNRLMDASSFNRNDTNFEHSQSMNKMSAISSSSSMFYRGAEAREASQKMDQDWERRGTKRSYENDPNLKVNEHVPSSNNKRRDLNRQEDQLWSESNKRLYDQRPENIEKRPSDLANLFDTKPRGPSTSQPGSSSRYGGQRGFY